jgi:hypothetical protein|tara:strand:+ start:261 stop:464 length:204 start_codon:yes stop_codon:yes gene_type:complete
MLNFHTELEYILLPTPLPLVKIRCRDERGSEDVTVLEDADEMDLLSILSACEEAYEKWQTERTRSGE